jgi:hypothetical protein
MATVPGPPTRLNDVCAVFGAPVGTPLNQFLRGGPWVPNIPANAGVPTVLPIRLAQLAGATNYVPLGIVGPSALTFTRPGNVPSGQSITGGGGTTPTVTWTKTQQTGSPPIGCSNTAIINCTFGAVAGGAGDSEAIWHVVVTDGISTATKDVEVDAFV